ncbi:MULTISPECIES: hypothetical protein [unclassified Lactococcus]|uniref:hypothetical protein n=1 Tax=unclassified Lactococcus TaxID=2643510 RepID=UPI0011CAF0AA|nr:MULTISPECIES: hypothetical protein [unclassified Lactococcus]MQW24018.1 hypothetical protein [Lactococcus sp. dk101]TXK36613.1 hypothetical protein FVP42_11075 [Lactococcus sp. dk310]TXK46925.1 hypothetical protein FVP43_10680 [Lactococcus sp. dk322]
MKDLVKDKYNLRYLIPIIIFFLILIAFLSSGVIKKATSPIVTTPINLNLNSESSSDKIQFKSANYYEKSHLLVTTYFIESDAVVPDYTLGINCFDGTDSSKIEAQVERVNANYYVVFMPNISSDFKQIANVMTLKNSDNSTEKLGAVSITQKNIKRINKEYVAQPVATYDKEYAQYAIEVLNKKQKNVNGEIKKYERNIKQITLENQTLVEELDFKTEEQQAEIQQKIDGNNSNIEGIKGQISTLNKQKEKLSEQKKILGEEE